MCSTKECAHIMYQSGIFENMNFYQGSLCVSVTLAEDQFILGIFDTDIALPNFDIFDMEPTLQLIKTLMIFA
jgi:hypothetical protein